jgi:DNA topoisomerase-1
LSKKQTVYRPANVAKAAGLYYVNDGEPGLTRVGSAKIPLLRSASGREIRDPRMRERVRRLVIPPAWTDVWICASPRGHIQAMGRDARGRRQYIYHPAWREVRDRTKFDRIVAFARALPRIRARVERDLAKRTLKERAATVLRLLDITHIRVGNEEYPAATAASA